MRILLPLLALLTVASCSTTQCLPPLAKTVRGEENFGEHVMIYGDYSNHFIWGIIFPRDTMTSISYTEVPEPKNVLELHSGITLVFVKNDVLVTKGSKKITLRLKPYTIYLINDDLSVQSSSDLSGIKVIQKTEYAWEDQRYVTVPDCVVPDDLYVRFGKNGF